MTPLVIRLFSCCRPFAICLFVIAIYINSVQCFAVWTNPHVVQKVFKTEPSFAHFYPTASIQEKFGVVRVHAPLLHCVPASVCSSVTLPMRSHSASTDLRTQASAASGFHVSQFAEIDSRSRTTITNACPKGLAMFDRVKPNGYKSSVSSPSHIQFVVASAGDATTGLCLVADQRIRRDRCCASAFALAQPSSAPGFIVCGATYNSQLAKCFSGQIFEFSHCTASFMWILPNTKPIRKANSEVKANA